MLAEHGHLQHGYPHPLPPYQLHPYAYGYPHPRAPLYAPPHPPHLHPYDNPSLAATGPLLASAHHAGPLPFLR